MFREGDLVVAKHEETGEVGNFPVTGLMGRQSAAFLHLELENGEGETEILKVTGEHPLFSPVDGWVQAKSLAEGDALVTHDCTKVSITFYPVMRT